VSKTRKVIRRTVVPRAFSDLTPPASP